MVNEYTESDLAETPGTYSAGRVFAAKRPTRFKGARRNTAEHIARKFLAQSWVVGFVDQACFVGNRYP